MSRISIVRDSVVRIVRMLTEKKVQVTQRGTTAYVTYNHDGTPKVVNIPFIPEDASDDLLIATQGFLDHEVAHVLFTDYAAVKKANEMGVASLHNIVEDSFIERKMAAAFAGSGYNLSEMGQYFLKNYTDVKLAKLTAGDPQIEGLLIVPAIRAWAGQKVFQDYMNDGDKWSMIAKVNARLTPMSHRCAEVENSMDALQVALDMKKLLEIPDEVKPLAPPARSRSGSKGKGKGKERKAGEKPAAPRKRSEDEEGAGGFEPGAGDDDGDEEPGSGGSGAGGEEASGMSGEAEPEPGSDPGSAGRDDPEEEDESGDDGLTTSAGDDADEDDEEEEDLEDEEGEGGSGGGSGHEDDGMGGGAHSSGGGGPTGASGDDLYKMLEAHIDKDFDEELSKLITAKASKDMESITYKIYSTDFDIIEPLVIREGTFKDEYLKNMQEAVDHMVGPLQKDFERAIAAKSATTWSGGHRSGRLHAAALSRLSTGDERIFRRKHINNGKDVAVSLLVDCSGSMSVGGKIKAAAYAAYALASVLDRMNITCEVLGFTTKGRMPKEMFAEEAKHGFRYARTQNLYMPILKGFSERLNFDTKKRFAVLPEARWLNENVDGECVAIAAQRLAQRREARKVMFVFSDGSPACPGDFTALDRHLKKTVQDVERSGIEVMGIGIADRNAAKYYSKHVVLTEISDLPTTVIGQIKKILMQ
jgi:cobaltochelatase CobT